jgi:alginate O-acetyltransferase complex protein AlgI
MLFTSALFLFIFLPLVLVIYFALPQKYRNLHLLIASIIFYAWGERKLVLIMMLTTVVDFYCAVMIENGKRKAGLILAIVYNVGLLFYFKYLNFAFENVVDLLHMMGISNIDPMRKIIMPLGISFLTFHSLSYVIDVYRREIKANRNIIDFGTYIFLFPHLIAGPIVRYIHIEKELKNRIITQDKFAEGIKRFIVGLAKKMIIANNCAYAVDYIFALPKESLSTPLVWLAMIAYTFQIFYDFSGYSDMAIGLGKMVGFDFRENFNYPYISTSIQEFWRRWHISLSTWFRDYVYIPLGGSRVSKSKIYVNLFIVFLVTGFWHGASWSFMIWGMFHGLFIVIERIGFKNVLEKVWSPVAHFYTLSVVFVGWVFFRADNMKMAMFYLKRMFSFTTYSTDEAILTLIFSKEVILAMIMGALLSMPVFGWLKLKLMNTFNENNKLESTVRFSYGILLLVLFVVSCSLIAVNSYNPFIYFRF